MRTIKTEKTKIKKKNVNFSFLRISKPPIDHSKFYIIMTRIKHIIVFSGTPLSRCSWLIFETFGSTAVNGNVTGLGGDDGTNSTLVSHVEILILICNIL